MEPLENPLLFALLSVEGAGTAWKIRGPFIYVLSQKDAVADVIWYRNFSYSKDVVFNCAQIKENEMASLIYEQVLLN